MDRGAGRATVHGVTKSWTLMSNKHTTHPCPPEGPELAVFTYFKFPREESISESLLHIFAHFSALNSSHAQLTRFNYYF